MVVSLLLFRILGGRTLAQNVVDSVSIPPSDSNPNFLKGITACRLCVGGVAFSLGVVSVYGKEFKIQQTKQCLSL